VAEQRTSLTLEPRDDKGSRATRRLRRGGYVPGVVYGIGGDTTSFKVEARKLRSVLAEGHALFDIELDGSQRQPVIVKEQQKDPVKGRVIHLDLLKVRLDQTIQSTVPLELEGIEEAPGVKEGGVLEHVTRELNIEALPTDIPDRIVANVSALGIAETMTLELVTPPAGVTLLDDLETVVATVTAPSEIEEPEEVEEEAELVGEEAEAAEGEAPAEGEKEEGKPEEGGGPVDYLVVGLGNPGSRYAGTRHNVGFEVANLLAERWQLPKATKAFGGLLSEGRAGPGGPRVAVLLPQGYMNESGRVVGPARGSYGVPLERLLVIHDEIDLPFGEIQDKIGGGLAGHNGLKSVSQGVGGPDFRRIRVGVGRPDTTDPEIVSAHVLSRFTEPARDVGSLIERAADRAQRVVEAHEEPR
jgi:PTH1 family peptidyl-tRNA hydrolase